MPSISRRRETVPDRHSIGIDPGKSGGIAVVYGHTTRYWPMPETPRGVYDVLSDIKQSADGMGEECVCDIEQIHSSPQMGVTSAFTFGKGYGVLLGCLAAVGISHEEVTPQRWQKGLAVPKRRAGNKQKVKNKKGKIVVKEVGGETKDQFKKRLRAKAEQLFPLLELWRRSMKEQLACCDAILIAEHRRRRDRRGDVS